MTWLQRKEPWENVGQSEQNMWWQEFILIIYNQMMSDETDDMTAFEMYCRKKQGQFKVALLLKTL